MITVFGATGKTGQLVVAGLVERGVSVRAFVRDAEKAQALLPAGVEILVGDLSDRDAVDGAVEGAEKVYVAVGGSPDQQQHEINIVESAAAAGVQQLVKVTAPQSSVDSPSVLLRWHGAVEKRIKELGLPATLLRPNWFAQNFLGSAATIAGQDTLYASAGSGHISPIDARDIADVALVVLTEEGHIGADYYLTGPESLDYPQVANRLSTALGRDVTYVDIPDSALKGALVEAGLPEWYVDVLIELHVGIRDEWYVEVSPVVDKLLGREPRSFEEFTRDHAAAFTA